MDNFRISRETFLYVCAIYIKLQRKIASQNTRKQYLYRKEWLLHFGFLLPNVSTGLWAICFSSMYSMSDCL